MPNFLSREERTRVSAPVATLALTLLFLVLFAALTVFMLFQSYRDTIQRTETRAVASSQVVSANIQWLLEASFQSLRRIDEAAGNSLRFPPVAAMGDLNAAVANLPGAVCHQRNLRHARG